MKKHFVVIVLIAFFGLFTSMDVNAQGRGHGRYNHQNGNHHRVQKAYRHGYYQGVRQSNRYERRHHGYYAHQRPVRYYNRPYRNRRHHGYYAPAPRPRVRGGVTINIPLPPHPPLPPRP